MEIVHCHNCLPKWVYHFAHCQYYMESLCILNSFIFIDLTMKLISIDILSPQKNDNARSSPVQRIMLSNKTITDGVFNCQHMNSTASKESYKAFHFVEKHPVERKGQAVWTDRFGSTIYSLFGFLQRLQVYLLSSKMVGCQLVLTIQGYYHKPQLCSIKLALSPRQ